MPTRSRQRSVGAAREASPTVSRAALLTPSEGRTSRRAFLAATALSALRCVVGDLQFARQVACAESPGPRPQHDSPNFVVVFADDLDDTYGSIGSMPNLQQHIAGSGVTFSSFHTNCSLCSPSRASLLRGQCVHNHGVLGNGGGIGGFPRFLELGLENSTLATELQHLGYRTSFVGKYFNGYPLSTDRTHIPPGWSDWCAICGTPTYFNYSLNIDGRLQHFGSGTDDYLTDVLSARAVQTIQQAASEGKPFLTLIAPYAPHGPAVPAPRHAALFRDQVSPRTPSFDEADVSDKPAYIRNLPRLTAQQVHDVDERHRNRLRCLASLDDLISAVVQELTLTGQLDRTYLVFTSDNGSHLGQHRVMYRKGLPYEESCAVPCLWTGPGVALGRVESALSGTFDIMPTILDLAGCAIPTYVDGRSLRPWLAGQTPADWRTVFLLENEATDELARVGTPLYYGLAQTETKYVEYATGEREFYERSTDPFEICNAHSLMPPQEAHLLSAWLARLRGSCGAAFRANETWQTWIPWVTSRAAG